VCSSDLFVAGPVVALERVPDRRAHRDHKVSRALKALRDRKVRKECQVPKGRRAPVELAARELPAHRGLKGFPARSDLLELLAHKVPRDRKVQPADKVHRALLVPPARRGQPDRKVNKVHKDRRDNPARRGQPAQPANRVRKALRDRKVQPVLRDFRGHKDPREIP